MCYVPQPNDTWASHLSGLKLNILIKKNMMSLLFNKAGFNYNYSAVTCIVGLHYIFAFE